MINGSPSVGVDADRIVFDRFSGYRTNPRQTLGVPAWEFVAKSRGPN